METALTAWLAEEETHSNADNDLPRRLRLPYTIYGCMLLLSHNAFQSEEWKEILSTSGKSTLQRLYTLLANHMKITHVAVTNPIPPSNNDDPASDNIIRSPSNFRPLYGDFGPSTASSPPTLADFDAAFWVTAKQNGIYQTWAPRWTMFSRGNISEKARIAELDSVAQAVEDGSESGMGCAAVDLYAGIGYFAFSYLKAGVRRLLCWDLNAWSCEGLKKGAKANGWEVADFEDGHAFDLAERDARLLVFNESNEQATEKIENMRQALPPIRHVNCGLLPTSRGSWQSAVDALDKKMGGWIHVHENFAIGEIDEKGEEVKQTFQAMLEPKRQGTVVLEHINHLKSYAPGIMHCVLDIYIPPCT